MLDRPGERAVFGASSIVCSQPEMPFRLFTTKLDRGLSCFDAFPKSLVSFALVVSVCSEIIANRAPASKRPRSYCNPLSEPVSVEQHKVSPSRGPPAADRVGPPRLSSLGQQI